MPLPRRARRGLFLVLEGPDKSGKSTQAARLVRHLRAHGLRAIHTREPGGTAFAEAVRGVVLDRRHRVHPLAELLLYEAGRAQHTRELLLPALRSGTVVVSERYALASLAYQGHGRGLPLPLVRRLNRLATQGLSPDLTLVLDMPGGEFSRRDRGRRHDRLESAPARFRRRVRRGYRSLARTEPKTALIDAGRPRQQVWEEIRGRVDALLRRRRG